MSQIVKYTCIGCPMGCPLELTHKGLEIIEVKGYSCNRGIKYAHQEFTDPRRGLSTTVFIEGGLWKRLPVKVTYPVPKDRVLKAAKEIHSLRLKAPVKRGEILISNFLGNEKIAVVATRTIERLEK